MHEAKTRVEARCHHGASGCGTQNGITIVKKAIQPTGTGKAPKIRPEQKRPVASRRLSLDVLRIAWPHFSGEKAETAGLGPDGRQRCTLSYDLCAHDLLPKALLQRRRRAGLIAH